MKNKNGRTPLIALITSMILILVFLGCTPDPTTGDPVDAGYANLDGIDKVPEWLLLEVEKALPNEGLNVWVPTGQFQSSSLLRIPRFPTKSDGIVPVGNKHVLELESIRNEKISAQIAVASTEDLTNLRGEVSDFRSNSGAIIEAENSRVRFVKFVPVHEAHIGAKYDDVSVEGVSGFKAPDVVGDPLVEAPQVDVPKLRVQPVWFTFSIPEDTEPGMYEGSIELHTDQNETVQFSLSLQVHDIVIPDPADFVFDLDIWFNPFSIADFYDVEPWSDEHWEWLQHYFTDLASRGQKKITTTIVEQPWKISWLHGEYRSQTESPYKSMVKWELQPNGQWSFDYSVFDRYVELAQKHGKGPDITAYSMLVFRGPERITYFDVQKEEMVEEQIDIMDNRYGEIWGIFLEDFRSHLMEKGWFDQTLLAFDERPEELMNRVFSIIRESAPEFEDKIYLSGGMIDPDVAELNIGYESLYEPGIQEGIIDRVERGLPVRLYQTCCSGPHPNRFTFNPASEIHMIGWLVMKFGFTGYVDWAYNSWPFDIFNYPVFNYPQGDEYFVYPGPDGPMSSIRWELFREGIEDFELVHVLRESGELQEDRFLEAALLATRNRYGEGKDPHDIVRARRLLLE